MHCGQLLTFPEEDFVEFNSIHKQVEHPFVVYADFESILHPINEEKQKTKRYQEHDACSFSYYIVSRVPGVSFEPKTYIGKNAAETFLNELKNDFDTKIKPHVDRDVDMIFDDEARAAFDASTECHICSQPLENDKV